MGISCSTWNNIGKNALILIAGVMLWRSAWGVLDSIEAGMELGDRTWMFGITTGAIALIILVNMDISMTQPVPIVKLDQ
jgi:hypothetical protein